MKIKIILTAFIASSALLFGACGNSANTTTTANNNANKANTTAVVVNSNQTNAANTPANTPANTVSPANKAAPAKNDGKIEGEYMVGDVKCTITPEGKKDMDLFSKVTCADNRKVETYSRDDDPAAKKAILAAGKSRFEFDMDNLSSGTFTDEKGKTVKVTRVQ